MVLEEFLNISPIYVWENVVRNIDEAVGLDLASPCQATLIIYTSNCLRVYTSNKFNLHWIPSSFQDISSQIIMYMYKQQALNNQTSTKLLSLTRTELRIVMLDCQGGLLLFEALRTYKEIENMYNQRQSGILHLPSPLCVRPVKCTNLLSVKTCTSHRNNWQP